MFVTNFFLSFIFRIFLLKMCIHCGLTWFNLKCIKFYSIIDIYVRINKALDLIDLFLMNKIFYSSRNVAQCKVYIPSLSCFRFGVSVWICIHLWYLTAQIIEINYLPPPVKMYQNSLLLPFFLNFCKQRYGDDESVGKDIFV